MQRWFPSAPRIGLIVGLGLVAVVSFAIGIAFGGGSPREIRGTWPLDDQAIAHTREEATTSSTVFENVRGLKTALVCAKPGLSADVSMTLSGAPVELRVVDEGIPGYAHAPEPLSPRLVRLDPGVGAVHPFAYTFVRRQEEAAGLYVQWRSPTGQQVTMKTGTLRVLYGGSRHLVCSV